MNSVPDVVSIYRQLIKAHTVGLPTESELLIWMLFLHTHSIRFAAPVIKEFPDPTLLLPATQRVAAQVVAGLWPDEQDKRDYRYWYHAFAAKYEARSEIPAEAQLDVERLRKSLLSDKQIRTVERFVP